VTFNPPTLQELGRYWVAQGGVNLGVVGDASHVGGGTSYHLGKSQLTATAYSRQTARDKAGLSEAASAIDLGRLDGTLGNLYEFSRWFAGECMDHRTEYRDVREVIFWSTARDRVIGWSSLAPDQWINDYGDLSHKTHTHISFYRDSEFRAKVPLFAPYFKTGAEIVNSYPVPSVPSVGNVAKGKVIYPTDAMVATDPLRIIVDPGRDMPYLGDLSANCRIVEYVSDKGVHSGRAYFIHAADLTGIHSIPAPVPDCTAAVAAGVAAATAPLNKQIAALDASLAAANIETANAEAKGKADEDARLRTFLGIG
jgi:hypothetical protein